MLPCTRGLESQPASPLTCSTGYGPTPPGVKTANIPRDQPSLAPRSRRRETRRRRTIARFEQRRNSGTAGLALALLIASDQDLVRSLTPSRRSAFNSLLSAARAYVLRSGSATLGHSGAGTTALLYQSVSELAELNRRPARHQ